MNYRIVERAKNIYFEPDDFKTETGMKIEIDNEFKEAFDNVSINDLIKAYAKDIYKKGE